MSPFVLVPPTGVPSIKTVMALFTSAVPVIVGVWLFVVEPFAGVVTIGADGAMVSTVNLFVLETLEFPAASVDRAWTA